MGEPAETLALTTSLYTSLDPSKREIRLLHRSKDTPDNDYRLSVFPFDDAPPFFALSYVWGSSEDRSYVVVESLSVPVTTNLAAALAHVWSVPECEYLWADALCINQSDTPEKNHQVPLMRHIYGRSSRVLMWLGTASGNSDLALDFLREWAGAIRGSVDELRRNGTPLYQDAHFMAESTWTKVPEERFKVNATIKAIFAQFPAPFSIRAFDDASWEAVDALFDRNYWTRIWTLQEVVLAKVATVVCGAKTLDLDDMIETLPMFMVMFFNDIVGSSTETERPLTLKHYSMHTLSMIYEMRNPPPDNDICLLRLANNTMNFGATDARDRAFALLGLLPDGATSMIANYSLSVQQVFTDVVVDHLNRTGRYPAIAGIGQNSTAWLPGLPSWVPDFTLTSRPDTKDSWQRNRYTAKATAASGTRTALFKVAHMPSDHFLLQIRGFICDQVTALSGAFLADRCYPCQMRLCIEEIGLQATRDSSSLLATGVPWLYAVFRSITAIIDSDVDARAMGNLAIGFLIVLGIAMDTGDHAWSCMSCDMASAENVEAISARLRVLVGEVRTTHPHLRPPIAFLAKYLAMNGVSTELTEESILGQFCDVDRVHLSASSLEVPCQDFSDAEYFALYNNLEAMTIGNWGAVVAATKGEHMGVTEPGIEVGDMVCIIFGCDAPIVARRVEQDRLLMVGQGRFYGMMRGEMMDKLAEGAFEEQDLEFV